MAADSDLLKGEGASASADFDAAQVYLTMARAAEEAGDHRRSMAARKMVIIALAIDDSSPIFHMSHIKK